MKPSEFFKLVNAVEEAEKQLLAAQTMLEKAKEAVKVLENYYSVRVPLLPHNAMLSRCVEFNAESKNFDILCYAKNDYTYFICVSLTELFAFANKHYDTFIIYQNGKRVVTKQ